MATNNMPPMNRPKGQDAQCDVKPAPVKAPDANLQTPDANVDKDGFCNMPAYAEAARADTGEPCVDGRNWPEAEKAGKDTSK